MEAWQHEVDVLEIMLKERGYTNIRPVRHGTEPHLLCTCRDSTNEITYVFVSHEAKVGVRSLRKMQNECQTGGARHLILLSISGLTPFATRELADSNSDYDIEIFNKAFFCTPVPHHHLVPRHTALSKSEKAQLLAQLGCKTSLLPKLKESDPVARYYHYAPGTVVRIDREIGSMESEPYFRVVG